MQPNKEVRVYHKSKKIASTNFTYFYTILQSLATRGLEVIVVTNILQGITPIYVSGY